MEAGVSSILQLNDDCLWCIFSYFDFLELLIVGSVCQRFEGVAQMFYNNWQSVDFIELLTKFKEKDVLPPKLSDVARQLEPRMIAMNIKGLYYDETFRRPGSSISLFPNLQHLKLLNSIIHEEYANIFPALKQIVLEQISFRDESVLSYWFNNLPHLNILKFNNIPYMTGECLIGLKGIEELKIENCKHIQRNLFEQFCQLNPQLKKLSFDLSFNNTITSNTFLEIITKYLKNLENLVIRDYSYQEWANYDILRDLPKVTKLSLDVLSAKQSSEFYHMLEHFATKNHIEYLNLKLNYYNKDILILKKLQQFPYLKVLKLKGSFSTFVKLSNFISCSTTLEELHIINFLFDSSAVLKEFIEKFKLLRLLNVHGCYTFKSSFLLEIEECLQNRSQMLEIEVGATYLAVELQKESKSGYFEDFLERTKEKLKLTIDAYDWNLIPKKSFHECEEWEK